MLRIGPTRARLSAAVIALATAPVGFLFGALAQIAACVLLLQALWLVEWKWERRAGVVEVAEGIEHPG